MLFLSQIQIDKSIDIRIFFLGDDNDNNVSTHCTFDSKNRL